MISFLSSCTLLCVLTLHLYIFLVLGKKYYSLWNIRNGVIPFFIYLFFRHIKPIIFFLSEWLIIVLQFLSIHQDTSMFLRLVELNFLSVFHLQLVPYLTTDFVIEGWLSKTGPSERDAYRKRWFILDDRKLMYHEGPMVSFFLPMKLYIVFIYVSVYLSRSWSCSESLVSLSLPQFLFLCLHLYLSVSVFFVYLFVPGPTTLPKWTIQSSIICAERIT